MTRTYQGQRKSAGDLNRHTPYFAYIKKHTRDDIYIYIYIYIYMCVCTRHVKCKIYDYKARGVENSHAHINRPLLWCYYQRNVEEVEYDWTSQSVLHWGNQTN